MKTYTFHVSIPGTGRVWRKIEMGANQTLEDLHWAIQDAFDFDGDHLYSFFMSGRAWDQDSEYCLPDGVDPYGIDWDALEEETDEEEIETEETEEPPPALTQEEEEEIFDSLEPSARLFRGVADLIHQVQGELPGADEGRFRDLLALSAQEFRQTLGLPPNPDSLPELVRPLLGFFYDDELSVQEKLAFLEQLFSFLAEDLDWPKDVRTAVLDELELKPRQEFLYLFDYGDEWRFKVRVHAISQDAPEGDCPRVVETVGEAPEQYAMWDDEFGDEEQDDVEDDDEET